MAHSWIQRRQRGKRVVEFDEVAGPVCRWTDVVVQRYLKAAVPFLEPLPPRKIHKDAAHQFCRHRKEVSTVLPLHAARVDQFYESLVDECRRLQRMAGT